MGAIHLYTTEDIIPFVIVSNVFIQPCIEFDDFDLDGVADNIDNCPSTYNPPIDPNPPYDLDGLQQADCDNDGIGDECDDPCFGPDNEEERNNDFVDDYSNALATKIKLFPNPTDSNFFIGFSVEEKAEYQLSIFNVLGGRIFEEEISIDQGKTNHEVYPSTPPHLA